MKDHDEDFPELEQAIRAIKSQESQDGPPDELCASTVEVLQAKLDSPKRLSRREIMLRFAKYGTLGTAASIAVAIIGSLIISGATSQPAFAQVLKNVRDAKSVTYKMSEKLGRQPARQFDCSILGSKMRMDSGGQQIILLDTTTRKGLMLLPAQKMAITYLMEGDTNAPSLDLAEVLSEITEKNSKRTESIQQDGKDIDVYDVSELPKFLGRGSVGEGNTFRVWVDRQSSFPTRVVLKLQKSKKSSAADMEFSNFAWNPTLEPSSFDQNVPAGYTIKDAKELQP